MKLPHRLGAILCVILSSSACDRRMLDDHGPVAALHVLGSPWTDPTAVSDIAPNAFSVTSVIPFPCAPYALVPRVIVTGGSLNLRVEGRYQNGCPQDVAGQHSYRADVVNVPSGNYQLRVIHEHREWAQPADTVFLGPIAIP